MPDANNILSGAPVQIAVNDSSNGTLYLGYLSADKVSLIQKPLYHKDISGLWYQYGMRTILKAEMLETDPTKIADLKNRRTTKQDIYITAAEYGVKLHDTYVQLAQKRDFAKQSVIELTAYTDIEDDIEVIKNLLSSVKDSVDYGNFEIDTNTDGLADGWTNVDMSAVSRTDPSFKNGAGNYHQNLISDNIDQSVYCRITWRFDQPQKITFSVYAQALSTIEDMFLQIKSLNSSDATITTSSGSVENVPITGSNRYSHSKEFIDDAIDKIEIRLWMNSVGTIKFDDAQLEFGAISDYTQND